MNLYFQYDYFVVDKKWYFYFNRKETHLIKSKLNIKYITDPKVRILMTVSKVGFGNRCQPSMDSFFFLFSFLSFLLRLVFTRNTPRTIETRSRVPHHHHFSVSSPSHPSAYSMLHETRWSLVGWLISPCQAGRRESGDKVKPEVETTVKLRLRR